MKILSMSQEAFWFLITTLFGFAMGMFFDVFKVLRKTFKHADFLTQIEDIIFWVVSSFAMFYLLLNKTGGLLRGYLILGAFIGLAIYFASISRFIVAVVYSFLSFAQKVILAAVNIILTPLKLLKRPLQKFLAHGKIRLKILTRVMKK